MPPPRRIAAFLGHLFGVLASWRQGVAAAGVLLAPAAGYRHHAHGSLIASPPGYRRSPPCTAIVHRVSLFLLGLCPGMDPSISVMSAWLVAA